MWKKRKERNSVFKVLLKNRFTSNNLRLFLNVNNSSSLNFLQNDFFGISRAEINFCEILKLLNFCLKWPVYGKGFFTPFIRGFRVFNFFCFWKTCAQIFLQGWNWIFNLFGSKFLVHNKTCFNFYFQAFSLIFLFLRNFC